MDLRRHCTRSTIAGSIGWMALVAWGHHPLVVDLFVLAPLVLAPLIMRLRSTPGAAVSRPWAVAVLLQLPAAALAAFSFWLEPGLAAGALTAPWVLVTGLMAAAALARIWHRGALGPAGEASMDVGLLYVVAGAGWWTCSRLGVTPLGFAPLIVLLTAVHFHYAGFVLPMLAGLGAQRSGGRLGAAAAWGVIAGVPLVALGITFSPGLELAAAFLTAVSGFVIGIGQIRHAVHISRPGANSQSRRAGALLALSGLSLMLAMIAAGAYGAGEFLEQPWPSIMEMIPMHGAINALGFALLGAWGWNLEEDRVDDSIPAVDH